MRVSPRSSRRDLLLPADEVAGERAQHGGALEQRGRPEDRLDAPELRDAILEAPELRRRFVVVIGPSVWKTTSYGVDQPAPRSRSNAS